MDSIGQLVSDYGFPIIAAAAMGYFIYLYGHGCLQR